MKGSEQFKKVIQDYITKLASTDIDFRARVEREDKNIDDCITYILNTVQKSGMNGFDDDEIYGMATHYYDEDKVEVGKKNTGGSVKVNHHVSLTESEKAEAKQKALDDLAREEKAKIKAAEDAAKKKAEAALERKKKKAEEAAKNGAPTLFG